MRINIKTDNEAFEADWRGEIARILRDLADRIESGRNPKAIHDFNGNKVGFVSYEEEI